MANPVISSATLDKASYPDNATMTATVVYGDPDADTGTVTFTVTDPQGNVSQPVTAPYTVTDAGTVTASDPERTWTKVSDNGQTAVFRATA